MKLLVTGGAGYIGTHAIKHLSGSPEVDSIVVYDNLSHGRHGFFTGFDMSGSSMQFIRGEILDTRSLKKALDGVDVVLHLAARVSTPFANGDPHMFEQVNHWGTAELSYLLEESSVQKVVYVSSASVYGISNEVKTVDDRPIPGSWYGTSKLRGERMLLRLRDRMQVVVLRCANVYGYSPSIRFDAVINRFVRQAHFERRISIEGDGQQYRPFAHIDMVAETLLRCCTDFSESGIFNLSERNLRIWDIAQELQQIYPDLETMFIEQDMVRQSLMIEPSPELGGLCQRSFRENIDAFISNFSFSP